MELSKKDIDGESRRHEKKLTLLKRTTWLCRGFESQDGNIWFVLAPVIAFTDRNWVSFRHDPGLRTYYDESPRVWIGSAGSCYRLALLKRTALVALIFIFKYSTLAQDMDRVKQVVAHLTGSVSMSPLAALERKSPEDVVITMAIRSPLCKARKGCFKDARSVSRVRERQGSTTTNIEVRVIRTDELMLEMFKVCIESLVNPLLYFYTCILTPAMHREFPYKPVYRRRHLRRYRLDSRCSLPSACCLTRSWLPGIRSSTNHQSFLR